MKVEFLVTVTGEGADVRRAYADMRRRLMAVQGWRDTDTAWSDGEGEVAEGEVQAARHAYAASREARRRCRMGKGCRHDVVVAGIPACMMDDRELKALVRRGKSMEALAGKS